MRVESAQPCPQTSAVPNAAAMAGPLTSSRSSSRIIADLPPSSRNTLVTCWAAARMMVLPVAVEPVKEIMSTRGSSVRSAPMAGLAAEITLKTPGGMSVCSVTRRPSASALHGVCGAGFKITAAGGKRRCDLGEVYLSGHVPWGDRRHDPDRFPLSPPFRWPPTVSAMPSGVVHSNDSARSA